MILLHCVWSLLTRPLLSQEPKLGLHRRLVHILRMRLHPGDEHAKGLVTRRGRGGETDQALPAFTRGFGHVVVVSTHEVAMTKMKRLAIARIVRGGGAQV